MESLRRNAHEFVNVASNRMTELQSDDVRELANQFTTQAQDLLDTVINLVATAPDILNRLVARIDGAGTKAEPTAARAAAKRAPAKKTATKRVPAKKAPAKKAAAKRPAR